MLTEQYAAVRRNIDEACARAGRDPGEVTLIAVSKTKPISDIAALYARGVRDFGENYIQELREKQAALPKDIRWHMIGHLQRNKVKYIAPFVELIHSVDSLALAETIEKEGAKHSRVIPVLLEINAAGEETKFGVSPAEAEGLARAIAALPHVHIEGLMTSAPPVENPADNREVFQTMKRLSVDIAAKNIDNVNMNVLSMGMTNDYVTAVEEGATLVRVGTAIFGARNYNNA